MPAPRKVRFDRSGAFTHIRRAIRRLRMHVSLPPQLEQMVREKVASGLYGDASEVVRAALRLMQERDEARAVKLQRLREALADGEADLAAGRFITFDDDDELEAVFARL
jgi:antitoxin ParD1/3/4